MHPAVFDAAVESNEEEAFVSVGQNGAASFLLVSVHEHFTVFGTKVSSQADVGRRCRQQRLQDEEGRTEEQRICAGGRRHVYSLHHQPKQPFQTSLID